MDLEKSFPLVLYDDQCYLCAKFAKIVNAMSGKKLRIIGHYSETGEKIRLKFLDSDALEMFWFIDKNTAYGGRAALLPLFKAILSSKGRKIQNEIAEDSCDMQCKSTKAVFLRSASLLSNSKKINL